MRNKTIAIHQPDYIPWLGFFYKVAHCDEFVYLDDAQYSNEAAHNFNVIKTSQGAYRLKIPVYQTLGDSIMDVRTKDELGWKKKHLKTIEMNYKRAKHFNEVFPEIESMLTKKYDNIADLNIAINSFILKKFGIHTPVIRSSEIDIKTVREERIIDICEKLNASEYLSGNGARVYQQEEHFESRGIRLQYLEYQPVVYHQLWPKNGFLPCMSAIDYIFNCGYDWDYVEDAVKNYNGRG